MSTPNNGYIFNPPPPPPRRNENNVTQSPSSHNYNSHPNNSQGGHRGNWRGGHRGNGQYRGGNERGSFRGRGSQHQYGQSVNNGGQIHHPHTPQYASTQFAPQAHSLQGSASNAMSQSMSLFPGIDVQTPTTGQSVGYDNVNAVRHIPSPSSRQTTSYNDLMVEGRIRPPAAPAIPNFQASFLPPRPPLPMASFQQQNTNRGNSSHRGQNRGRGRGGGRGRGSGSGHSGQGSRDGLAQTSDEKTSNGSYDISPEELVLFKAMGGKIKGTNLTLEDPEELAKWITERKKNFPTAARLAAKEKEAKAKRAQLQNEDLQRRLAQLQQSQASLQKQVEINDTTSMSKPMPSPTLKRRKMDNGDALNVGGYASDSDASVVADDAHDEVATRVDDEDAPDPEFKNLLAASGIDLAALKSFEDKIDPISLRNISSSASSGSSNSGDDDDNPAGGRGGHDEDDSSSESNSDAEPETQSTKIPQPPLPDIHGSATAHEVKSAICRNWLHRKCTRPNCPYLHEGAQPKTAKEKREDAQKRREEREKRLNPPKKRLYQMLRENDMDKENVILLQAITYLVEQGALKLHD